MSAILDHGADAAELVEGIESGDIDPASVSIEPFVHDDDKVLTPELAERLPDEKVERYNELAAERDREELREESKLTEEQERALTLLEETEDNTAEVELGSATVTVKTEIERDIEEKAEEVLDSENRHQHADVAMDVICHMIVDEEFAQRELWEAYREKHGTAQLMLTFMKVLEPFLDRIENDEVVKKFRQIER